MKLRNFDREKYVKAVLVLVTSLCMAFMFSVRPVRMAPALTIYGQSAATSTHTQQQLDFIKAENQKAIDEIKLHIQMQNDWFHYKFILVGAVIAFFLNAYKTRLEKDPSFQLIDLLNTDFWCMVLALASLVSIAIDMHVRDSIVVVQQLGLWITYYAEPALLQSPFSPSSSGKFLPWEQFLRQHDSGTSGMHRDDLYGFAFYPHLHFITWVLCISYFLILLNFWRRESKTGPVQQQSFAMGGYLLVQSALLVFTWLAHAGPSALEFKVNPISDHWVQGDIAPVYFLPYWAVVAILNFPKLAARLCGPLKPCKSMP